LERERDLLLDPCFFHDLQQQLPRITAVQILLKRGQSDNELTRYRYDVVLEVQGSEQSRPPAVRVQRVPNRRWSADLAVAGLIDRLEDSCTVERLRYLLSQTEIRGEDPETFWMLAEKYQCEARVSWHPEYVDGSFDAELIDPRRAAREAATPAQINVQPLSTGTLGRIYANDPWGDSLRQQLAPTLRKYLEGRLPPYMVPATIVVLDELPLTENGKVNRRALPTLQTWLESQLQHVGAEPRTPTEQALSEIWKRVLNLQQLGMEDNFFELGGHSLLGQRLARMAADRFATPVPVLAVFQFPTVRKMAQLVEMLLSQGDPHVTSGQLELDQGVI
jgi:hypothetical protein